MADTDIITLFTCILPFRDALLSMLAPFDISKFRAAVNCTLTLWEETTYLDVLDDIFEDASIIHKMTELGLTVRVFGADLDILIDRLEWPCRYVARFPTDQTFHVFVLVTENPIKTDQVASLLRDYRPECEQEGLPLDMNLTELREAFGDPVAGEIASLSHWIFCAPYLSGTVPGRAPGWIPVFNSQAHVNVRAYISTFQDCHDKILYMERGAMQHVFGYLKHDDLLLNVHHLSTAYLKLTENERSIQHTHGRMTTNVLHEVHAAPQYSRGARNDSFVVINRAHSRKLTIMLALD
jgi:hypothetical protein